jgi:hypothetical protein
MPVFLSTGGHHLFGMWLVAVKVSLLSGESILERSMYSYLAGGSPDPHDRVPKLGCHEGLCTRLSTSCIDKLLKTALGAIEDSQDKILCQQFCVMWVWVWRWYCDAKCK